MLTYNELIELRNKLINNEIGIEAAKSECWKDFNKGQRSWHTKDWKERRAKIIKEQCEICNSRETLTLQHHSHPKKYLECKREITTEYAKDYVDSNPNIDKSEFKAHIQENYIYIPVTLCPKCNGRKPNRRTRKLPPFRCGDCKYEFEKPIHKSVNELISIFFENEDAIEVRDKCFMSKDEWRNVHNLSNIRYWLQRERAKNKDLETIEKEAFLHYLNDNIKYLSFEDTITACKKCASNFDLNKMELCPKCKNYYKGIQYPTCIQCLPEEKRKVVQKYLDFSKEM